MTSLHDRRRRYVAREITTAAMELFGERGYDDVTVEEIAEKAGLSARSFFRYFATKEELVLQFQRRVGERLIEALAARPADEGPVTALRNAYLVTSHVEPEDRAAVVASAQFLATSPSMESRALGAHIDGSRSVVDLVAERMGVDPDSDPRPLTIAVSMAAAASGAFHRWAANGGRGDAAETIDDALGILEAGLGRHDGLRSDLQRSTA